MSKPPSCNYAAERGWLSLEHLRDCADAACRGCRPCGEDHCQLDGRCAEHVEHEAGLYTCPRCIGRVRRQTREILDRYALVDLDVDHRGMDLGPLLEQAGESGIESEAFNLIGPAADPGQWAERRRRLVMADDGRGWCAWPKHEGLADDDPHHPYAVLGRWDMAMRESYGPQTDLLVTVSSAVDYLTGSLLDRFAHTQEFEEFARDVAACLTHLESVLQNSREPERGAPCPACTTGHRARLVKHYAKHAKLKRGEVCEAVNCHCGDNHPGHCRICAGHLDTWHCPTNTEHWWSDADYRLRVDGAYVEHATELPALELAERVGVSVSTVRKWAARVWDESAKAYREPLLVSRRKGADGRKVYPVRRAEELAGRAVLELRVEMAETL